MRRTLAVIVIAVSVVTVLYPVGCEGRAEGDRRKARSGHSDVEQSDADRQAADELRRELEELRKMLETGSKARKYEAVGRAFELGRDAEPLVPDLATLLQDTEQAVRLRGLTARTLVAIAPDSSVVVDVLVETLHRGRASSRDNEDDLMVMAYVATALGEVRTDHERVVRALATLLASPDTPEPVLTGATAGAYHLGLPAGESLTPHLLTILKERTTTILQIGAAKALVALGRKSDVVAWGVSELKEDNAAAAAVLGEVGREVEEAVPGLIEALTSERESIRVNAAGALGPILAGTKDARAIAALIESLEDPAAHVRSNALYSLCDIDGGNADVLAKIQERLEDSDPEVRQSAQEILAELRDSRSQDEHE